MKKTAFYILTPVLMSACASVGSQYAQPKGNERSAEISVEKKDELVIEKLIKTEAVIVNVNDKGCYSGKTEVDDPIRIHADKPIIIGFEKYLLNSFKCRSFNAFTPEANAKYELKTHLVPSCEVQLFKVTNQQRVPVPMTPYSMQSGFACMRLVPEEK